MRLATFAEIEEFLRIDHWRHVADTDHRHYEKVIDLPTGPVVLHTMVSFARDKTPGPDRFKAILREQLKVTERQFWRALQTKQPAVRPRPPEVERPESLPAAWVATLKTQLYMTDAEIAALTRAEARRLLQEHWSKPR